MVNKHLAKYLGSNDAALVLVHLLSLQEESFKGQFFFQQQERIMEECNVSLYGLRKIMSLLIDENLLTVSKIGMPATNHYLVNTEKLQEVLALDLPISASQVSSHIDLPETESLDLPKTASQEMPISVSHKDTNLEDIKAEETNGGNSSSIEDIPDGTLLREKIKAAELYHSMIASKVLESVDDLDF